MRAAVRVVLALSAGLAFFSGAYADTLRLLPEKPEVRDRGVRAGYPVLDVRVRDASALDILLAISATERVDVDVDEEAVEALRATILTVDLRDRDVRDIVDLIAVAAGVDVDARGPRIAVTAPPKPGSGSKRTGLLRAAQRFYEIALTQVDDPDLAAEAIRGLADLYRASGEPLSAYTLYETLLTGPYRGSPAAEDAELWLADCYIDLGQTERAGRLLRGFVDKGADRLATERAFRRLVRVLVEQERYREVEDLRAAVAGLGTLEATSVRTFAEQAGQMIERGAARHAAAFLGEVWRADEKAHAPMGPVLSLALARLDDSRGAREVLERSHLEGSLPAVTLWALSELARDSDRLPEALVFARRALLDDDAPSDVRRRCHILMGEIFESLGLAARARSHFYEAELLSNAEQAARLALRSAELTLQNGETEHARLLFQAAGDYPTARHEAALGVARALYAASEPARALDRLRELLRDELRAELATGARLLASDCLAALGRWDDALEVLNGETAPLEESR